MTNTPHIPLPLLDTQTADPTAVYNSAQYFMAMLTQPAAKDKDLTAPPASPATGDRYIIAASPTGLWAGKATNVTLYNGSSWIFAPPVEGWEVALDDEDHTYRFNGSTWEKLTGRLLTGTAASINPASLAALTTVFVTTVTVTNAVVGDTVEFVGHGDTTTSNWERVKWFGTVSAAGTVSVSALNTHSSAVDLASATVTVRVRRA